MKTSAYHHYQKLRGLLLALGGSLLISSALATPYASQVTRSGNTVSFVLNHPAAGITVLRDGGNPVTPAIDATAAGTKTFDMTGFSTYSIIVTGNTTKAWTQYVPDGTDRNFWHPDSVAINKNPASTNFGKVYVANNNLASPGTTGGGRVTTDGIYVLSAGGQAISGPHTGGVEMVSDGANYTNPFKININPDDDCVYVANLYDDLAYSFNEDLSVATSLVDDSNKGANQYVGSIYATGSRAAGNLKVYLLNPNYNDGERKGVIAYDIGNNATVAPNDLGTQMLGPDCFKDGTANVFYPSEIDRDSEGNWYTSCYRATAGQAPDISKFDGSLGWPINTVVWNSDGRHDYVRGIGVNEAGGTVATGRFVSGSGQVYFYSLADGTLQDTFDIGNICLDVAFDIAGNMVSVDNSTEYARFWSPGGYSVATTKSDGTFELYTPPTLTVRADEDAEASEEGSDPAVFTITRSKNLDENLAVHFTLSGTATSNVDYTVSVASPFVLQAGMASTNITITPINDNDREATETVILNLAQNDAYYLGNPSTATINIIDNDGAVLYWDVNGPAIGATDDFSGSAEGTWGSGNTWNSVVDGTGATTAWIPGAAAVFSAGDNAYGQFTVTINGTQTADFLSFEDGYVTLGGGTLNLGNADGTRVTDGMIGTINSVLAGTTGLLYDGPGTLELGGNNTYTGATEIRGGTLQIGAAERIPNGSTVKIGATGKFSLQTFDETIGGLAGDAGAILESYGGILTFGGNNADTTWDGEINNNLPVTKVGSGTTTLTTGTIIDDLYINAGTIAIADAARLGSFYSVALDNGAVLRNTSAAVGGNFIQSGKTMTIGAGGGTLDLPSSGAILFVGDGSPILGTGTLTKTGPAELRTYGVEHSFGKLVVAAGLYTVGHSTFVAYNTGFGGVPASPTPDAITIMNGAQIRKAGGNSIALDPNQGITLVNGGTLRSFAGNAGAGTFEIPSPISGTGLLTLGVSADAAPVFILSGNNTYSGGTFVNAGVTDVRVDGGLGTGDVTVTNGATLKLSQGTANAYINSQATLRLIGAAPVVNLDFTGAPNTIKGLSFGGVPQAAGTWGAIGSGADHESAFFTGTGMLNVTSGGTAPQPVTDMQITGAGAGTATINYSGGTGNQFVLLRASVVTTPLNNWERVATNTAAAGSFSIAIGAEPQAYYRIQSE